MAAATLDAGKADAFVEKMTGILNGAALALMTSVGHRTGLFDVMARFQFASSDDIADAAGLSERYVREWLGAMVTGGIVEYDAKNQTYDLPREHAASLTRAARPANMAVAAQFIAVLGHVEDAVVDAFRHGRGVPYSAYHRFHEVMAEESDQTAVAGLTGYILPLVPGLESRLELGIDVLDVGCGSGRALIHLAGLYPASQFVGHDFSEQAIAAAQVEAARHGLANVRLEVRDVAERTDKPAFDLILAFDAIHDQVDPAGVLRNISAALRPGGVFLMQDIGASSHLACNRGHPIGPFLYTISCMHCMSVSLAGGGPGLGAVWGEELAKSMLADAGFTDVRVHRLPHDPMNYYYVCRK
jgi:2-polyprenyl-3-methyl-5-hydroxy-6-metoxy-1,4-benzoquinol methylase